LLTIDARSSTLLVVDFQIRLMPAIEQGAAAVANARLLIDAAAMLGVPTVFTEENGKGLGPTVKELTADPSRLVHKMTFDACREPS
jgi:nicotinamidase-related amidase